MSNQDLRHRFCSERVYSVVKWGVGGMNGALGDAQGQPVLLPDGGTIRLATYPWQAATLSAWIRIPRFRIVWFRGACECFFGRQPCCWVVTL